METQIESQTGGGRGATSRFACAKASADAAYTMCVQLLLVIEV